MSMLELKGKKILVTGGHGFLGSRMLALLKDEYGIHPSDIFTPGREELDLRFRENCVRAVEHQDVVFHLAGTVGGIGFNQEYPAQLFYDNIMMGVQLMDAAYRGGVKKFITLGTICSYPKFTSAPFKEEDLWNGYPEETNAPYGLAKKMLLVQAQVYRAQYGFNGIILFPTNLYGPGDNFDLKNSHVLPALIRKVIEAKKEGRNYIEVWGTGNVTREFLYVDDAARGIIEAAMQYDKSDPVNLGSGREISIKDLVSLICKLTDFDGEIRWDATRPDGQPRRFVDTCRAQKEFGFNSAMEFEEGVKRTIEWYEKEVSGKE
ncbi:MAG: GDP-L-fucose synthase [Patescibacteria group bacterium]|nr:GDP-L-fucose synthase [Patescibacteria group bacterium]